MILRPYQVETLERLRRFKRTDRVLVTLPVGSGKTTIFSEMVRSSGRRCLVIAHRRELIQQAHARLAQFGIDAGIIMSGVEPKPSRVQVASIQTLTRRELPEADVVVYDEAHHLPSDSYRSVFKHYASAFQTGWTATPFRLDGQGLGEFFDVIVAPVSVRELCNQGVLIEPTVYAPSQPDLKGVHTRGGDYVEEELAGRMIPLVGRVGDHYRKYGDNRRFLAFAVNIAHSKLIAMELGCEHLDGTDSVAHRAEVLQALRDGRIRGVSSCNLFGEGFDLPALEIAILARPTKSLALHIQQIGRIMRAGKSEAIVLDHAGNHHRHGRVTEEIEFSLDSRVVVKKANDFRTCKQCYAIIPLTGACPECGYEHTPEPVIPEHVDGELEKFLTTVDKHAFYAELVDRASAKGYRMGWCRNQYKARFGGWPRMVKDIEARYVCPEHEWQQDEWGTKCARCLTRIRSGR